MECRRCSASLSRPGDYCLVCRTANADTVVVDAERDRARVTVLADAERVGTTRVTTTPEGVESDEGDIELRNFAGLIADEVHRKRPEEVYAAGDRAVISRLRRDLPYELKRVGVGADDPVEAVLDRRDERSIEVVDASPAEKMSGTHTMVIGGRRGREALTTVAEHPHVKKVIPGPIESGGAAGGGIRATATRADAIGNLGLRVRDGSSVQENRVVTTAGDRETGEVIREDVNEALAAEGLE
jgi:hypothetical protein